ncbi:MAG: hypothetical protein ACR2KK_12995 [Acidimicrobiales bacterium]
MTGHPKHWWRDGRTGAALACALVLAAVHAGGASAAHVARLEVRPGSVAPGSEVSVFGPPGWAPAPVSIRWNTLDGQVLGTFPTTPGGNASFGPGTVKVPDVPPGVYELVGTQDAPETQTALRGVPARARVVVTGAVGAAPPAMPETPPVQALQTLEETGGPSTPSLVLLGVGLFALTLALGLIPGLAMRRRAAGSRPAPTGGA